MDEVVIQLSDGDESRGTALVGCDGLNSAVRSRLLDYGEPRYAGYTSWRGLCPRGEVATKPSR
jgi:2-polyprenyl-6-methoxyphenol hydroxylase-like FAD-dependent oxidoreductase